MQASEGQTAQTVLSSTQVYVPYPAIIGWNVMKALTQPKWRYVRSGCWPDVGTPELLKFLGLRSCSKLNARWQGKHRKSAWPCLGKTPKGEKSFGRCRSGFILWLICDTLCRCFRSAFLEAPKLALCVLLGLLLPHSCCTLLHLLGNMHPFSCLPKTKSINTFRNQRNSTSILAASMLGQPCSFRVMGFVPLNLRRQLIWDGPVHGMRRWR